MISANLGHAAQVLSGPDDRAFCSHFGVSDAFDASALVADGAALLRRLGPCHVHCAGYFSCAALRKTLPRLLLAGDVAAMLQSCCQTDPRVPANDLQQ